MSDDELAYHVETIVFSQDTNTTLETLKPISKQRSDEFIRKRTKLELIKRDRELYRKNTEKESIKNAGYNIYEGHQDVMDEEFILGRREDNINSDINNNPIIVNTSIEQQEIIDDKEEDEPLYHVETMVFSRDLHTELSLIRQRREKDNKMKSDEDTDLYSKCVDSSSNEDSEEDYSDINEPPVYHVETMVFTPDEKKQLSIPITQKDNSDISEEENMYHVETMVFTSDEKKQLSIPIIQKDNSDISEEDNITSTNKRISIKREDEVNIFDFIENQINNIESQEQHPNNIEESIPDYFDVIEEDDIVSEQVNVVNVDVIPNIISEKVNVVIADIIPEQVNVVISDIIPEQVNVVISDIIPEQVNVVNADIIPEQSIIITEDNNINSVIIPVTINGIPEKEFIKNVDSNVNPVNLNIEQEVITKVIPERTTTKQSINHNVKPNQRKMPLPPRRVRRPVIDRNHLRPKQPMVQHNNIQNEQDDEEVSFANTMIVKEEDENVPYSSTMIVKDKKDQEVEYGNTMIVKGKKEEVEYGNTMIVKGKKEEVEYGNTTIIKGKKDQEVEYGNTTIIKEEINPKRNITREESIIQIGLPPPSKHTNSNRYLPSDNSLIFTKPNKDNNLEMLASSSIHIAPELEVNKVDISNMETLKSYQPSKTTLNNKTNPNIQDKEGSMVIRDDFPEKKELSALWYKDVFIDDNIEQLRTRIRADSEVDKNNINNSELDSTDTIIVNKFDSSPQSNTQSNQQNSPYNTESTQSTQTSSPQNSSELKKPNRKFRYTKSQPKNNIETNVNKVTEHAVHNFITSSNPNLHDNNNSILNDESISSPSPQPPASKLTRLRGLSLSKKNSNKTNKSNKRNSKDDNKDKYIHLTNKSVIVHDVDLEYELVNVNQNRYTLALFRNEFDELYFGIFSSPKNDMQNKIKNIPISELKNYNTVIDYNNVNRINIITRIVDIDRLYKYFIDMLEDSKKQQKLYSKNPDQYHLDGRKLLYQYDFRNPLKQTAIMIDIGIDKKKLYYVVKFFDVVNNISITMSDIYFVEFLTYMKKIMKKKFAKQKK